MTRDSHSPPIAAASPWPRSPVADLLVFVVVGMAIVAATFPTINARNLEIGDFAANSLLIQDAKHLALLKGNYSRIGVHHPGPAILYVLALGELLFNDLLHWTKSPFSGQLIAGCFYTGAWTAVVSREFRKLAGSWTTSIFATSIFLFALSIFSYNFFSEIWFPDLYVFPFAAFTLAMARLASGRTDSLIALAISAGFLFNGHVSFVPTLGIVFVVAMIANAISNRRTPECRVVGVPFLRANRKAVAIAVAVFAMFFVPIVIETILTFPGPVANYVGFGATHKVHRVIDSLNFVAGYWGGGAPMIGSLAAAAVTYGVSRHVPALRAGITALLAVFVGTTIALFVYARYGIDDLVYTYLGLFYYTTPALLFAALALVASELGDARRWTRAMLVVAAACLAATYWNIHRPVRDADQYNRPAVVAIHDAIKAAATGGRIVLDLDDRREWDYLWMNLVGSEALARRRHENLFCVNKNWHILFTDAAICRPDELQTRPRFNVRVERGPRTGPVAFEAADLVFQPYRPPDITDAGPLTVKANGDVFNDYILTSGWSSPEGELVWTMDRESHLALRIRPGFSGVVVLTCGAFLVPGHTKVTGSAYVDGKPAGTFEFTMERGRQTLVYPIHADGPTVDLKIVIDNPASPARMHVGNDPRKLGVSLYSLEIKAQ